jgi:hypothetical protein
MLLTKRFVVVLKHDRIGLVSHPLLKVSRDVGCMVVVEGVEHPKAIPTQ